jgi:hypothetical protein
MEVCKFWLENLVSYFDVGGGGTTVNWSASLELPQCTRKEWAETFGLKYFNTEQYAEDIEFIRKRLGMDTKAISHNIPNQILIDGCKKLNYKVDDIPQNTAGNTHRFINFNCSCGWCGFGCPYGEKQSSMVVWIRDAVESGCHLIQQASVTNVVHSDGKVQGVKVVVEGKYDLFVKAKRVVVSCGAINSPALLLRSNINNVNIGTKLKLHPVNFIFGYFPDKETKQYHGSIMTSLCNQESNVNGDGYGSRLEVPSMHPGLTI